MFIPLCKIALLLACLTSAYHGETEHGSVDPLSRHGCVGRKQRNANSLKVLTHLLVALAQSSAFVCTSALGHLNIRKPMPASSHPVFLNLQTAKFKCGLVMCMGDASGSSCPISRMSKTHLGGGTVNVPSTLCTKLPLWTILAHGDFAHTLSQVKTPLASAIVPGRCIYFVTEPELVAEITFSKFSAFRNRQDSGVPCRGVVGAVGDSWKQRRDALRTLQQKHIIEHLAAPAVADALWLQRCPANALMLPPDELLKCSSAMVRHAMNVLVLSAQPPRDTGLVRLKHKGHSKWNHMMQPLARLMHLPIQGTAKLLRTCEQTHALLGRKPFFNLAQQFTGGQRKIQRVAAALQTSLNPTQWLFEMRDRWHSSRSLQHEGSNDWVKQEVSVRWHAFEQKSASSVEANAAQHHTGTLPRDLLDTLLASNASPSPLNLEEVIDVVKDVLTAGGETTASTLTSAALLLKGHPDAAEKVAQEASEVLRDATLQPWHQAEAKGVDVEQKLLGLQKALARAAQPGSLPYTRAVLLEASRLFPAAPLLLRVALHNTSLGGVPIEQGSGLVANIAGLGRHESWEKPDSFIPERFLPGHQLYRSAQAAKAYMAFGAGPRSCVGQQLALTIASLTLAHMVVSARDTGFLPIPEATEEVLA